MYNLGFTTVTFRELSRREICEAATENNIKNLEWGGDVHIPPEDSKALSEALSLQKEFGINCLSYGSYYRLGMKDYDAWEKITDTASSLGAAVIRIWMGSKSSRDTDETLFYEMLEETKVLAKTAEEKNLTVAFEFHKGTYNDGGEASLRFLNALALGNVKTYWQPMSTKADAENLKAVLPYLVGVHIFQWNFNGKRYALKRGKRKWKRFFEIVRESGSPMNYIMEFVKNDCPRQFTKDAKTLKKLLNEVYG